MTHFLGWGLTECVGEIVRRVLVIVLLSVCAGRVGVAQESRFATADSRRDFVHWIELRDGSGKPIDPADPASPPYSPRETCGKCHDYGLISQGHHFNANAIGGTSGRPGEPWIWTDRRSGTQIPLSYRRWPGTYHP